MSDYKVKSVSLVFQDYPEGAGTKCTCKMIVDPPLPDDVNEDELANSPPYVTAMVCMLALYEANKGEVEKKETETPTFSGMRGLK